MPAGMNPFQISAFWVWYKSANGDGKRSFQRSAERCGVTTQQLSSWHAMFKWDALAAEKDKEFASKTEKIVEHEVLSTYRDALERQRKIIAQLYAKFTRAIERMDDADMRPSDLIKLMEYETQFMFEEERGVRPTGNMLSVVLQMMPPEARTEFNAAVERARDAGQLRLAGVELSGRN